MSQRLQRAAEAAFSLDKEMSEIREEIQEAQSLFSYGKGPSNDDPDSTKEDQNS